VYLFCNLSEGFQNRIFKTLGKKMWINLSSLTNDIMNELQSNGISQCCSSYLLTYLITYLLTYLLNYLLTYTLTHSLHAAQSFLRSYLFFSASQEIPRTLGNPKFHYRSHNSPPPVLILSQLDPVHPLLSHFLMIHVNIILPSTPWSPKWSLSLRFPHQNLVHTSPLPHTCHMFRPSHSSRFDHPNNIWWSVQIIKLFIM
jgi:hypothetical protein